MVLKLTSPFQRLMSVTTLDPEPGYEYVLFEVVAVAVTLPWTTV